MPTPPKKLIISQQDFIYVFEHHQIMFCQANNNYTNVVLHDGKEILVVKSLSKFAKEELNSEDFIRVSQSYLINKNFVQMIDKKQRLIRLKNEYKIHFTTSIKELVSFF